MMRQQLKAFALEVAAVVLAIGLAAYVWPGPASGQSVFNDQRHEVTVRNNVNTFACSVVNSAATTLTAFGGQCAAPTVNGQAFYITDITASASAAATATTDQYLELKSGTGTNCGTGTAVVWAAYNAATSGPAISFTTPIAVAANSDLCWMDAVTGSKTFIVQGFIK